MIVSRTWPFVAAYFAAIVAANLSIATFGPGAAIVNAFVFISLDMITRDVLQDAWQSDRRRQALLIAAGSLFSAALDWQAAPVALASFVAFASSQTVDALAYTRLRSRPWLVRANGSNVPAALTDSVVFLGCLAALGGLPWALVPGLAAAQWGAKVLGGALWSAALSRWRR